MFKRLKLYWVNYNIKTLEYKFKQASVFDDNTMPSENEFEMLFALYRYKRRLLEEKK